MVEEENLSRRLISTLLCDCCKTSVNNLNNISTSEVCEDSPRIFFNQQKLHFAAFLISSSSAIIVQTKSSDKLMKLHFESTEKK